MLLLSLVTSLAVPAFGAQRTANDAVFRKLVLERIRAYGRGDAATYLTLLADGFVHVSDLGERRSKDQMRAYVKGHGDSPASYAISRLSWRTEGNLAIVEAEVRERVPDMENALRETDILKWQDDRWLYLLHHETAVWQAPIAVAVTGDRLADYAGRYRTSTGTIDIITTNGRNLFGRTLPDVAVSPLVQVGRGAFGLRADPTLVVFLRDRAGSVTGCLWHLPSGQTVLSHRIE